MKKGIITFAILLGMASVGTVSAGTLYPTSEPGTTMYSLQDIYDLIVDFSVTEEGDGSELQKPSNESETQVTLTEIYELILDLKNDYASLEEQQNNQDDENEDGGSEVIDPPVEETVGKFSFSETNTEDSNAIVSETESTENVEIFSGNINVVEGDYYNFSKLELGATVKQANGDGYGITKVVESVTLKIDGEEVSTTTISSNTNTAVFSGFSKKITSETSIVIEAKIKPLTGNYEEGFSVAVTDLTFTVSGSQFPYMRDTSKKKTFLFLSN